jgi:predicted ATPase with chaperone activity
MVTGRLGLSAQPFSRILKVARTIADDGGQKSLNHTFTAPSARFRLT